jgi:hypothetical protein
MPDQDRHPRDPRPLGPSRCAKAPIAASLRSAPAGPSASTSIVSKRAVGGLVEGGGGDPGATNEIGHRRLRVSVLRASLCHGRDQPFALVAGNQVWGDPVRARGKSSGCIPISAHPNHGSRRVTHRPRPVLPSLRQQGRVLRQRLRSRGRRARGEPACGGPRG